MNGEALGDKDGCYPLKKKVSKNKITRMVKKKMEDAKKWEFRV